MKLLCWMHRKFRQNTNEALKALVIGQSSLDDQQYFPKPNNYGSTTRPLKQVQRDHNNNFRNSFTGSLEDHQEDHYEEDAIPDLFHGFLAIGTLGSSDQINMVDHPATPTFSISVENITEKETEVTENELKLINDELEKVLSAEPPEDGFNNDCSGRNSHVSSNGRSSHGSIITLSGKGEDGNNNTTVCPLQGYLFGSAIELSETTTTVAQANNKKEHRTSLGELFQRSKVLEESGGKNDKDVQEKMVRSEKDQGHGGGDKSTMNMMKKKFKKKMLHGSSRSSAAGAAGGGGGGPGESAPTETKLHKILHMFHRKVHPETTAAVLKSGKPQKNEQKKKRTTHHDQYGSGNCGGQVHPDHEDVTLCPQRALFLKQKIRRYRSQSNPPQFTFGSIDSNGNREQWIKTDADYLVLEL